MGVGARGSNLALALALGGMEIVDLSQVALCFIRHLRCHVHRPWRERDNRLRWSSTGEGKTSNGGAPLTKCPSPTHDPVEPPLLHQQCRSCCFHLHQYCQLHPPPIPPCKLFLPKSVESTVGSQLNRRCIRRGVDTHSQSVKTIFLSHSGTEIERDEILSQIKYQLKGFSKAISPTNPST